MTGVTGAGGLPPPAASPLDLRHLTVLCEIARTGSFAAAASELCFTPSAVSQQMARLESRVGAILFERLHHGTRLTPAGEALLGHAHAIFGHLADAQSELRSMADGCGGSLRVGSFPTGTGAFVAAAFEMFRDRFPGVVLHLVDGEPYENVVRMHARELDLAVVFAIDGWPLTADYDGHELCPSAGLVCEPLFEDPFVLVLPRSHPLARRRSLRLEDLVGQRIVGSPKHCPPWGPSLLQACAAIGVELTFDDTYRTVDFPALEAVVAAGRGVSLMPALATGHLRRDLCTRLVAGAPFRRVSVALREGVAPDPACATMLEILKRLTDSMPAAGHAAGEHGLRATA